MTPDDPDFAAMARLRDGEDLALNEIMERWELRVTSFLLRMIGNPSIAVDLAQETFVRVYQHRARFRPQSKFSTWLFAIAANLGRQHFRWQSRHPALSFNDAAEEGTFSLAEKMASAGADPGECLGNKERARLVRDAVMALPPDLREAVILFEYEDLSHQQIAVIADCSAKAVETRLYRARAILRERLKGVFP